MFIKSLQDYYRGDLLDQIQWGLEIRCWDRRLVSSSLVNGKIRAGHIHREDNEVPRRIHCLSYPRGCLILLFFISFSPNSHPYSITVDSETLSKRFCPDEFSFLVNICLVLPQNATDVKIKVKVSTIYQEREAEFSLQLRPYANVSLPVILKLNLYSEASWSNHARGRSIQTGWADKPNCLFRQHPDCIKHPLQYSTPKNTWHTNHF